MLSDDLCSERGGMNGLGPEVEDFIRWTGGGSGRNVPVVQVEWKVNKGKKRERRLKYWVHFR